MYNHFDDTSGRAPPGLIINTGGKCPLYDASNNRKDQQIEAAEKKARDKVRSEHPELSEEDLKIKFAENVQGTHHHVHRPADVWERQYVVAPPMLPRFNDIDGIARPGQPHRHNDARMNDVMMQMPGVPVREAQQRPEIVAARFADAHEHQRHTQEQHRQLQEAHREQFNQHRQQIQQLRVMQVGARQAQIQARQQQILAHRQRHRVEGQVQVQPNLALRQPIPQQASPVDGPRGFFEDIQRARQAQHRPIGINEPLLNNPHAPQTPNPTHNQAMPENDYLHRSPRGNDHSGYHLAPGPALQNRRNRATRTANYLGADVSNINPRLTVNEHALKQDAGEDPFMGGPAAPLGSPPRPRRIYAMDLGD